MNKINNINEFKPGHRFKMGDGYLKIMAVVDGYILARHKGCFPFVNSIKDFKITYGQYEQTN